MPFGLIAPGSTPPWPGSMTTVRTLRTGVPLPAGWADADSNRHPATAQKARPRNTRRRPQLLSRMRHPCGNPRPKRMPPINWALYCETTRAGRRWGKDYSRPRRSSFKRRSGKGWGSRSCTKSRRKLLVIRRAAPRIGRPIARRRISTAKVLPGARRRLVIPDRRKSATQTSTWRSDTPNAAAASALVHPSTRTRWTTSARRATVIARCGA